MPFEIPHSWAWTRLGNTVIFENGDRSNNYPVEADYVDGGIPFWGAKDIIDNKLTVTSNLRYISNQKFNSLSQGKLHDNDFVCLLRGAVGKWAIFNKENNVETGFINAQMVIIRPINCNYVDWLKMYLSSGLFESQCVQFISGTAIAQMSAKDLSTFLIPIPPIIEQAKIFYLYDKIISKVKGEN